MGAYVVLEVTRKGNGAYSLKATTGKPDRTEHRRVAPFGEEPYFHLGPR